MRWRLSGRHFVFGTCVAITLPRHSASVMLPWSLGKRSETGNLLVIFAGLPGNWDGRQIIVDTADKTADGAVAEFIVLLGRDIT